MPCYDSRNEPDYVRAEARREFRHNSDVAEMLCWLMVKIQAQEPITEIPIELATWWIEHKARDEARVESR